MWRISTKYYIADVQIVPLVMDIHGNCDGLPVSEAVGQIDSVEAVIYYFEHEHVSHFILKVTRKLPLTDSDKQLAAFNKT